ncbi:MAG: L,D-transpeptidase family protein [Alphaproteobacteria bacterium]|nr:L,D-transpeptidase family protein [Alphaproteobacteria bacterium]
MDIVVAAQGRGVTTGTLKCGSAEFPCALGPAGIVDKKCEGDGGTPTGTFLLREVLYRADRLPKPETALPLRAIAHDDGWCDAPDHAQYNGPVKLPFTASHEKLWREDEIYDVLVVLGYNDSPVVPGKGSAIFMHVARPDFTPTQGCVALRREDLLALLKSCAPGSRLTVMPPA